MKKLKVLLLTCLIGFSASSCFDDMDDNIVSSVEIKDFIWKSMNYVYLYKSEIPDLADDRFTSSSEYVDYLDSYSSPEDLFASLKYLPTEVDRFSGIYSNYYDLQNLLSGTTLSNGMEYNLYYVPGSQTEVFGVITLVLANSPAESLGLQRGQIFRAINGENLSINNYTTLLSATSYTLNFADYDDNGTTETTDDDTLSLSNVNASLTKVSYTENPVHKTEILTIGGSTVGYLMYNGFTSDFDNQLNAAFGEFNAAGISDLIVDLRYNGGGSVQTAAYLGSMVTGQFTGQVYSKLFYNENLANNDTDYLFTNTINGGGSINSVNLSRVYVLTSERGTASASELLINSLKPYIEVVVIGENTVGKTQASRTVYDSPTLFSDTEANPSHTYALQPLIANSTNVDEELVPSTGMVPDILISESATNLGILGDVNEPLLAEALAHISGSGRSVNQPEAAALKTVKLPISALEQDMHID
ncbi:S41 family peptidase [Winogradskyella arenosi]|uniref:Peptidase S41-like protein n=1 Tax=Winogradskyella arenosi TaxID=533325 RepID=A0A368ZFN1_9FLAO|nr:S41 family peptidase [Winogradskyella arenosi]RCW91395.1 peptidase S41-like protein [Winogradskyella arenosi]